MELNKESFNLEQLLSQGQELIAVYGLKVLGAFAIFFIGRIVARMVAKTVRNIMNNRHIDQTVSGFVHNLLYAGLLTFVIVAALGQIGIQTASFIAILGAAGLAVGLALQGSLSNFASGVLLVLFKPFKVGDYIEAGGSAGTVQEILIFSTILTSPDNKTIILPNSGVLGGNITNYSTQSTRRVDLVVGVSYDASIRHTKTVLTDLVKKHSKVLSVQEPTISVLELADSSVNFAVRVWVNTADYWAVYFDLLESIKLRLDEEKIGIPYPQMNLHFSSSNVFQPEKELVNA